MTEAIGQPNVAGSFADLERRISILENLRLKPGSDIRLWGPITIDSGSVAAGAESTVVSTHSLGLTGVQVVAGFLFDGSFASYFGWRAVTAANSLTINFHNDAGSTGQAILRCYILEAP